MRFYWNFINRESSCIYFDTGYKSLPEWVLYTITLFTDKQTDKNDKHTPSLSKWASSRLVTQRFQKTLTASVLDALWSWLYLWVLIPLYLFILSLLSGGKIETCTFKATRTRILLTTIGENFGLFCFQLSISFFTFTKAILIFSVLRYHHSFH